MAQPALSFDKFAQEAHHYLNELAEQLGHPDEESRVLKIWRSVMHSIRDRIHLGEAFQVIDPLPMIFKGIFVENWKFSEKPPLDYQSLEQMKEEVKKRQAGLGEQDFPWSKSTEEIIAITLHSLSRFLGEEQLQHLTGQLPGEIKEYLTAQV